MQNEVIEIIYKDIVFRRYPNSERRNDRVYYKANSNFIKRGISYLHREIWKEHNGKIPKGYVIHHIDENPDNNNIDNFELITRQKHMSNHAKKYCRNNKQKVIDHLNEVRPLQKAWHKSEAGKALHKYNGKYLNLHTYKKVCCVCGKIYTSKRKFSKFCGRNCLSQDRRQSGLDNETRECSQCGDKFITNKYTAVRFCSKKCAGEKRREQNEAKKRFFGKALGIPWEN